ncbi:hypothetical protein THTE_4406 [Thermogutta terrifontis]|uniref:Uncharacterized protein n=1 Tax=Thermogutta terrifontis TaxID=1331910 RepID=A0A286RM94_9BACT|nr:hypothetical protein THTE_4406 [Thermogutta terrifontis]
MWWILLFLNGLILAGCAAAQSLIWWFNDTKKAYGHAFQERTSPGF